MRSRTARLLAIAVVLAGAGAAAGFAIHKATGGSSAPLRDCAGRLAKAQRQLRTADRQLSALRKGDAKLLATFRGLSGRLKAIGRKYPNNVLPPDVYTKYKQIQEASDAAYKRYSSSVDRTNAVIASRNAIARRYNKAAACGTTGK